MRNKGDDFAQFITALFILIWHYCTTSLEMGIAIPDEIMLVLSNGSVWIGIIGVCLFLRLSGAVLHRTNMVLLNSIDNPFLDLFYLEGSLKSLYSAE